MRTFKSELHCHSMPASGCGRQTPAELAERYVAAGYTTVVLTNHLSRTNSLSSERRFGGPAPDADWQSVIDYFMTDFHAFRQAANGRLCVLLGVEFRLTEHTMTDYLVFGVTETFLRQNPHVYNLNIKQFSETVRDAGFLLVQPHPFRNKMVITDPALLDGMEVYNGTPTHASRNDMAEHWAERYALIPTSGSDLHRAEHPISGGILTDTPIRTNEELLAVLRSRDYDLIREGCPGTDVGI